MAKVVAFHLSPRERRGLRVKRGPHSRQPLREDTGNLGYRGKTPKNRRAPVCDWVRRRPLELSQIHIEPAWPHQASSSKRAARPAEGKLPPRPNQATPLKHEGETNGH